MQGNLKLNLYTIYIPTIKAITKKDINSIFYIKNYIKNYIPVVLAIPQFPK